MTRGSLRSSHVQAAVARSEKPYRRCRRLVVQIKHVRGAAQPRPLLHNLQEKEEKQEKEGLR